MTYWLRWQSGDFPLHPGTYFIGRSPAAHIVVNDPRVSRSHASVTVDEQRVVLRDLNSQNGVYLNGRRVTESQLNTGDRILIGGQELELFQTDSEPERRTTTAEDLSTTQRRSTDEPELEAGWSTRRADPIDLLSAVAEKTLTLGRPADAERMMQAHLRNAIQGVRQGTQLPSERAERMAALALRLAVALKKTEWVNYVFELYTVLEIPCPTAIIETLYAVVRQVTPVSVPTLRNYIEVLRSHANRFGPAERFLVQRIEGLERVVMA